eukprot:2206067-Prymnesium_polylepis.1
MLDHTTLPFEAGENAEGYAARGAAGGTGRASHTDTAAATRHPDRDGAAQPAARPARAIHRGQGGVAGRCGARGAAGPAEIDGRHAALAAAIARAVTVSRAVALSRAVAIAGAAAA